MKGNHNCVENMMHQACPVCNEDLFTSRASIKILDCSHCLHAKCLGQMLQCNYYQCPICYKSMVDMSESWQQMDLSIQVQPMPPEYANSKVKILCNDCQSKTEVPFHLLGNKCANCKGYNTAVLDKINMPVYGLETALGQMHISPNQINASNNNSANNNNSSSNNT